MFVAGIWSTGSYPCSLGYAKAGPRSGRGRETELFKGLFVGGGKGLCKGLHYTGTGNSGRPCLKRRSGIIECTRRDDVTVQVAERLPTVRVVPEQVCGERAGEPVERVVEALERFAFGIQYRLRM